MAKIDDDIEFEFYRVVKQKISILDFESWIYNTPNLEESLPNDLYLDLITLNYKSKFALIDLTALIQNYIDFGKFEIVRIRQYLKSIIDRDNQCAESIEMSYELYCSGYTFLRRIGLKYGLLVACPPAGKYKKSWSEISISDQEELLNQFYPGIIDDAKHVVKWLDDEKILIKNSKNELGHYEYEDLRTQEEKLHGEIET